MNYASHNISETSSLNRLDDSVRELLRIHAEADACRNEFGRFLLLVFFGPRVVYNQLGDAALHIEYDRFVGILVRLTPSCIEWVNAHGIYNIIRSSGFPMYSSILAFERTQVVDWVGCRNDAARVVNGMTGHANGIIDFFRYDHRTGDIDDLPPRHVGGCFESHARGVSVRLVSHLGEDRTPVNTTELAYRPWYLAEYCRRENPPSLNELSHRLRNEGERRDFNEKAVRDRRDKGMPAYLHRFRTRGVGVLSDRIEHVSRRECEDYAFRMLGPETRAQLDRRAQRAKDLGVEDAVVHEIVPDDVPSNPPPPEPKPATQPIPKIVPKPDNTPKASFGLSMPWDTSSQASVLDVNPDVADVKKTKDEAKQELRKELEKRILVPMRTKLRGSSMIKSGGSAEQLLPSLDSVGEYYCGVVTQLGKAAELFKRQKYQLAASEATRDVSVKEINKLKVQAATAKCAASAALSKLKAEHESELSRLRKEKTDDSLKRKAADDKVDGYRRDIAALEKNLKDAESARVKAADDR